MMSCSRYNLAPNDILCSTYTQIKVTKKNSNLVIKNLSLALQQGFPVQTSSLQLSQARTGRRVASLAS